MSIILQDVDSLKYSFECASNLDTLCVGGFMMSQMGRVDFDQFLGHGVYRGANLLLVMLGRDKESQASCAFFNRWMHNWLHANAALEHGLGKLHGMQRVS